METTNRKPLDGAHTPGPWESVGWAVHADNGREIIFGQHNTRSGNPDERAANARLIAEAPAMLAALTSILYYHDTGQTVTKWTDKDGIAGAGEVANLDNVRTILARIGGGK